MDKISQVLDAECEIQFPIDESLLHPMTISARETEIDLFNDQVDKNKTDDYDFARKNIIKVIEEGMFLVKSAAAVAVGSESARSYEVVANLIKTIVDVNKDLVDLNNKAVKQKEVSKQEKSQQVINQNNQTAVFCGATEDLFEKLFGNREKTIPSQEDLVTENQPDQSQSM